MLTNATRPCHGGGCTDLDSDAGESGQMPQVNAFHSGLTVQSWGKVPILGMTSQTS